MRESRDAVKEHGDADREAEDCVCEDGVGAFHVLCYGKLVCGVEEVNRES